MESDETRHSPVALQTYAGMIVFFNPHWVPEIKICERTIAVLKSGKLMRCRQRIIIIHTLVNAYQIPTRWWIKRYDPASLSILLSTAVTWRRDTEDSEHILTCSKRHKHVVFEEKESGTIKFSYLDVERVEHRDGTVLWQKQR